METSKSNVGKWVGVALAAIVALVFLFGGKTEVKETVGGNFNPVVVDFAEGITVDGTTIISGTGAITTSTLTATGATSLGAAGSGVFLFAPTLTPTADTTLTAAQSGTTVAMGTAGLDVTLPAVAASNGVWYRFVVSANYATTSMTVVSAEGDNIEGELIVAGAVVDCSANDVITSVNDGEDIGDHFMLYSNGTNWFIGASGGLTASKLTCSG